MAVRPASGWHTTTFLNRITQCMITHTLIFFPTLVPCDSRGKVPYNDNTGSTTATVRSLLRRGIMDMIWKCIQMTCSGLRVLPEAVRLFAYAVDGAPGPDMVVCLFCVIRLTRIVQLARMFTLQLHPRVPGRPSAVPHEAKRSSRNKSPAK